MEDLKEVLDLYINRNFQESKIKSIDSADKNISKEYKWYKAKGTLNPLSFEIFCEAERLPVEWGIQSIPKQARDRIESVIKHEAFKNMDWGRKRNIHYGSNNYMSHSLRITSSRGSKWTSYNYYADYCLMFHRNAWKFVANFRGKLERFDLERYKPYDYGRISATSFSKYLHCVIKRMIDPATSYFDEFRHASSIVFPGNIIKWNEDENAFQYNKHLYHIASNEEWVEVDKVDMYKKRLLKAFKKRRDLAKWEKGVEFAKNNLDKIWVNFNDSINAGNCPKGTSDFVRQNKIELDKIGGLRADYLLQLRNDNFTKRAVQEAAKRYIE